MTELVQEKERAESFRASHMTARESMRGTMTLERIDELLASYASEGRRETTQEIVHGLSLRGIRFCDDLIGEDDVWESVAEPEPQHFATFLEAYDFQIKLAEDESYLRGRAEQAKDADTLVTFIGCIGDLEDENFTQEELDKLRELASALREKIKLEGK